MVETAGATARAARAVEWQACRELVESVGHETRLFDLLTRTDPEHRPEYVRIADVGGRPVSIALVVPRRTVLGGLPLDGAIVTLVGTEASFRGRGLLRLLLEDTLAFIRARGFRLAMLYGVPELYPKFGFVPCLGNYSTVIAVDRMPPSPAGSAAGPGTARRFWRPVTDGDAPALAALFATASASTPCTVGRGAAAWQWREPGGAGAGISVLQEERRAPGAVLTEGGEAVSAYVRWRTRSRGVTAKSLIVPEAGGMGAAATTEALRWATGKAAEVGLETVRFTGPPDHPFSRFANLLAAAAVIIRPATAGQVLVTNRGLLMADLVPTLERRAILAGLPSGTKLVLDVGSKRFDLLLGGQQLRVLGGRAGRPGEDPVTRLSAEAFTYLLTGYAGGGEIDALSGTVVAPEHREALAALFPRLYPKWVPAPYWGD